MSKTESLTYPALYKKDAKGAIQEWRISVLGDAVFTCWGQVEGKLQTTKERVAGKNVGRSNETSPAQQAKVEAKSAWQKQKDRGYVDSIEQARKGTDDVGLVSPMLALVYEDHHHKLCPNVRGNVYASPKLDGIRLLVQVKDWDVTLYSRGRKPVVSVPHIARWFATHIAGDGVNIVFDGEMYSHKIRKKYGFEKLQEIVMRKNDLHPWHEHLKFHCFDVVIDAPFQSRYGLLKQYLEGKIGPINVVHNEEFTKEELPAALDFLISKGFEGMMVRQPSTGTYESGKRSAQLLKMKKFFDEDFEIVGVVEGKGKLAGHAGSFSCVTSAGDQFEAKLEGSEKRLKQLFENPTLWKDKLAVVRFQEKMTSGKPRFPVVSAIIEKGEK